MSQSSLDRTGWIEKLLAIDESLVRQGGSARLMIIGSAIGIFAGQPERTSVDLDVWKPKSRYQLHALKKAVEDAGMLFDPKSTLEPDIPYVQLIEPGVAEIGKFEEPEVLEQFQALTLERPPIANIVAAKLIRAEEKDLQDIAFLMQKYRPSEEDIKAAIHSMPKGARDRASENMVYLSTMSGPDMEL
jgi:hypothetical protein